MEANSEESGDQNEQQKRPEIVDDPELEALLNGKLCGHCISERNLTVCGSQVSAFSSKI
jgi:hypothetical protein